MNEHAVDLAIGAGAGLLGIALLAAAGVRLSQPIGVEIAHSSPLPAWHSSAAVRIRADYRGLRSATQPRLAVVAGSRRTAPKHTAQSAPHPSVASAKAPVRGPGALRPARTNAPSLVVFAVLPRATSGSRSPATRVPRQARSPAPLVPLDMSATPEPPIGYDPEPPVAGVDVDAPTESPDGATDLPAYVPRHRR